MAKISLHDGLKTQAPSSSDASTKLPKGPSVNQDATRSATTPNQQTLGPRSA